jgi:ubiquinol-cytochrome c reductase iron-sulfur subunit
VSKLGDWLIALVVMLLGRGRRGRRLEPPEPRRLVADRTPDERAELVAGVLFLCAAASAAATPFLYGFDVGHLTQSLGLSLGLACAFVAAALVVVGRRVVVTEELDEPYPVPEHEPDQEEVVQILEESDDTISRKRFLLLTGGAAAGTLGLAFAVPAASLGPVLDIDPFFRTPWKRGRRLVDEEGKPYRADAIEQKVFYTAYPEGADREDFGAPLIVVRLDPDALRLPPERQGWAPEGILAYSKICTHAGCAISLYRVPTFAPTEPKPALVCPCHYSTFDPADGGSVLFGPAGRPLPQLPLQIDASGDLRAAGNFPQGVGPSWWGVRNRSSKP